MSLLELFNECTVRLIYLGDLQFGVLRPRQICSAPSTSMHPVSTCANETLPVESEPTNSHVETSVDPANQSVPIKPGHVETKTEPVSLKEEQADTVSTIAPTLPADESDISECLVYSVLEPSSYIFERNLKIELHKLTADEIAQWIKPPTETCEANKGYRLRVNHVHLKLEYLYVTEKW